MDKYAKLMKGLEVCAGPDCCKDGCPYYGETVGGTTCRARLLLDAKIAIDNEQALRESAEEEMARLHADVDDLEAANNTYRAERDGLKEYALVLEKEGQEARAKCDKLNQELTAVIQHRDELAADIHHIRETREDLIKANEKVRGNNEELRKECDMMATRCTVLQNEINALVLKFGKQDGETDRPSALSDDLAKQIGELVAHANYQQGRADVLAAIVERCSFGGGGRHE